MKLIFAVFVFFFLARMFHKSAKLPPNPVAETSISPDHEIRSY